MDSVYLDYIYIIDDDVSVGDSLETLLSSVGLACTAYNSAQEFLDRALPLKSHSCLVVDIHMPHIGGLRLSEILAERDINVPIIFITGRNDDVLQARAKKIGCVALLNKPLAEQDLARALAAATVRARH